MVNVGKKRTQESKRIDILACCKDTRKDIDPEQIATTILLKERAHTTGP